MVFGDKVLRIFRPKREEVTGGWRKLHNEELHNLYSSPNDDQMNEDKKRIQNFGRKAMMSSL
jgi:hypothetical protein